MDAHRSSRRARSSRPALRCGAAALFAISAGLAGPAMAADLVDVPAPTPPPAAAPAAPAKAPGGPTFYGTFYLWGAGLEGTTSTLPPLPATDVNLGVGDILKDFDGGLMGAAEMRLGNWSVIGDAMITQISPEGTLPGRFQSDVKLRSRSVTLQGDVLYRLYASQHIDVDAGIGLRYWYLDNRMTITPGFWPNGITFSETENWVDPVIAGRVVTRLGGPWSLTFVGDLGGFDVGSQFTWQAIGTLNYQVNDQLSLRAGYRALSVDYKNGDFEYDVLMQGPILGLTYRF